MKRFLTVFSFLLLLTFGLKLSAQILEPVSWKFSSTKIGEKEYELVFRAEIDMHWHLYSQDIPMSPPATSFTFTENSNYKLIGDVFEESTVIEEYDPNFEMVLKYYANEAIFKQKVQIIGDGAKVVGAVEFMSCDDTKCLPPTEVDFNFTLGTPTKAGASESKILEPVVWEITSNTIAPSTYEFIFNASIDKGYHLYSLTIPEDGPLPTVFTFEDSDNYKLEGDVIEAIVPIEEYDDVFEMDIKFFENKASFKQIIKLENDNTNIPIIAEIAYMVCNEVGCVALYEDIEINFDGSTGEIIEKTPDQKEDTVYESEDITGAKASFLGFFILSFLGGLAAILTPCVFPMIPMTVSFFMKETIRTNGCVRMVTYD